MKKSLLILSLLLITGCVENFKKKEEATQTVKETKKDTSKQYTKEQLELKKYLDEYLGYLHSLDTEGIIDMTYPKLFIPINKIMFKRYINTLLSSPHISIESFDTNITNIGEVQPYSDGKFAQIEYKSSIKLIFINPNLYNDDLSIRVLKDTLQDKYGKENIKIYPEKRVIIIHEKQKLLAIKENNKEWKFIGDNPEYRKLYPDILPLDILSKI